MRRQTMSIFKKAAKNRRRIATPRYQTVHPVARKTPFSPLMLEGRIGW